MNIRLLSDIHTEIDFDKGSSFAESQNSDGIDVCVLAGDIITRKNEIPLQIFADKFEQVIYIFGNHDFWYCEDPEKLLDWGRNLNTKYSNLHFLENDIKIIKGQRFLGCTLWVPETPMSILDEPLMNDFNLIPRARPWIYEQNAKSSEFLNNNVQDGDFIITHHLPSRECIADKWKGDRLNIFFANDDFDHIWYDKTVINAFGHTHDSFKGKKVGKSIMHCNPRGYNIRNGLNNEFDPNYIIKI